MLSITLLKCMDINDVRSQIVPNGCIQRTILHTLQAQSNSASNNDENTNLILLELIYNNIYTGQDHVQSNVANDNIPPAEVEHDDGLVNEDQEMEQGEVPCSLKYFFSGRYSVPPSVWNRFNGFPV